MFRPRKVAIIMLCISHVYGGELYIRGFIYSYKRLKDEISASHKVYRQASFYAKVSLLKNAALIEDKILIQNSVFPGG